jgi:hypothetical protein
MKNARSMITALVLLSAPAIAASASRGGIHQCLYNCPPPVGSISAPAQVAVPAGGTGTATIRWKWDQSRDRPVTQYSCLWVNAAGETNAHIVQCEGPRRVHTVNLPWIGVGTYTFRVAPASPHGPFTKPIAVLPTLAQANVVGVPQ